LWVDEIVGTVFAQVPFREGQLRRRDGHPAVAFLYLEEFAAICIDGQQTMLFEILGNCYGWWEIANEWQLVHFFAVCWFYLKRPPLPKGDDALQQFRPLLKQRLIETHHFPPISLHLLDQRLKMVLHKRHHSFPELLWWYCVHQVNTALISGIKRARVSHADVQIQR